MLQKLIKKSSFLGKLQHSNDYREGYNQFFFQISIQTSSTKRMKKLKQTLILEFDVIAALFY